MFSTVPRQPAKQVVEGADLAPHQRAAGGQQFALDPIDVRPVRHDQEGFVCKRVQVALQQERDFARVGGPGQQRQGHRPILDLPSDGLLRVSA